MAVLEEGRTVRRELLGADTDWYDRSGRGKCTIRPDLPDLAPPLPLVPTPDPEVEAEVDPVDKNEETLDGVRVVPAAEADAEEDDGVTGREKSVSGSSWSGLRCFWWW